MLVPWFNILLYVWVFDQDWYIYRRCIRVSFCYCIKSCQHRLYIVLACFYSCLYVMHFYDFVNTRYYRVYKISFELLVRFLFHSFVTLLQRKKNWTMFQSLLPSAVQYEVFHGKWNNWRKTVEALFCSLLSLSLVAGALDRSRASFFSTILIQN